MMDTRPGPNDFPLYIDPADTTEKLIEKRLKAAKEMRDYAETQVERAERALIEAQQAAKKAREVASYWENALDAHNGMSKMRALREENMKKPIKVKSPSPQDITTAVQNGIDSRLGTPITKGSQTEQEWVSWTAPEPAQRTMFGHLDSDSPSSPNEPQEAQEDAGTRQVERTYNYLLRIIGPVATRRIRDAVLNSAIDALGENDAEYLPQYPKVGKVDDAGGGYVNIEVLTSVKFGSDLDKLGSLIWEKITQNSYLRERVDFMDNMDGPKEREKVESMDSEGPEESLFEKTFVFPMALEVNTDISHFHQRIFETTSRVIRLHYGDRPMGYTVHDIRNITRLSAKGDSDQHYSYADVQIDVSSPKDFNAEELRAYLEAALKELY